MVTENIGCLATEKTRSVQFRWVWKWLVAKQQYSLDPVRSFGKNIDCLETEQTRSD